MKELFSLPDIGATLFFFGCLAYVRHVRFMENPPRLLTWVIALSILITDVQSYRRFIEPKVFSYVLYVLTAGVLLAIFICGVMRVMGSSPEDRESAENSSWDFMSLILAVVAVILSISMRGNPCYWLFLLIAVVLAWPLRSLSANPNNESVTAWFLWFLATFCIASACWNTAIDIERVFFAILVLGSFTTFIEIIIARLKKNKSTF